jgi:hypothetical protein
MRIALALAACIWPAALAAQTSTNTLTVNVGSLARLSLSPTSLTFPDADPGTVPQVPALPGPVTVTVKARAARNSAVTLTVQASGDLRSGVTTLPASLIAWTATGAGMTSGSLSTSATMVGTWIGSGVRSGTQSFQFENRWTHPSGTYTVTLMYTLSSP